MKMLKDTCEFCKQQFTRMGNELLNEIQLSESEEVTTWCGLCREGRDAQYWHFSLNEVIAARDKMKWDYESDPLTPGEPTDTLEHLLREYRQTHVAILNQVILDREP